MEQNKEKTINSYPKPVSLETTEKIIEQMKNCVCKICVDDKKGTGFFCKIPFPDNVNLLQVLITNNHVIDESNLEKKITLSLNNDNEIKEIELKNRIKYTDKEYDITIIEIKDKKDGINKYLELDTKIQANINTLYVEESIYILHFPYYKNVLVSYGILKKIEEEKKNFVYLCYTENGSSGAPIINLSNSKIIGMHKETINKDNYNIGLFLNEPIRKFLNKNCIKYEQINVQYDLNTKANKRLWNEFKNINKETISKFSASLINNDLLHWNAFINGPENSPYEGGIFCLEIYFPKNYPFTYPRIFFKTPIYHPNFKNGGEIGENCCCALPILGPNWSPCSNMRDVFLTIYSKLENPNPNNTCGGLLECSKVFIKNKNEYERIAKEWTKKYASKEQMEP